MRSRHDKTVKHPIEALEPDDWLVGMGGVSCPMFVHARKAACVPAARGET